MTSQADGGPNINDKKSRAKATTEGIRTDRKTLGLSTSIFAPSRISGIYVLLLFILVFGILAPTTFLTTSTLRSLLAGQAITGLVALALVAPLASGAFDLSPAGTIALSNVVFAILVTGATPMSVPIAVLLTVTLGVLIGLSNALVINIWNVTPVVATLGTSSVLAGLALLTTGGKVVIGLPVEAKYLANWSFLAVPGPAVVLVLLSAIVSILLGMTSFGRQVYAVGANREAARLSGVNVKSVSTATLVISGVISSIAGILITARIGAGSPAVGPEYLLPGFAAVFLGSTQVRPGRFNVPGTLIAVFMLATGVRGLRLVGADNWVSGVFYGIALIVAVAVSNRKSIK